VVKRNKSVLLSEICHFGDDKSNKELLSGFMVDFSQGISLPDKNLCKLHILVIHNIKIQSAHYDIILPAKTSSGIAIAIPISCKASFMLSSSETIDSQLKKSKENDYKLEMLIWLYLGVVNCEKKYQDKFAFLNGAGCCNGLSLDMFILTKKLISQNSKSV
jgi:hypothetical protein